MKIKSKVLSIILALMMLLPMTVNAGYFTDSDGDKYETEIDFLYTLGIVEGDETGKFNPENELTRAEFLTMVFRMMGYESMLGGTYEQHFSDVSPEHWAFGYIEASYQLGIAEGMNEGYFGANEKVTLNQASKILLSALGYGKEAEMRGGYPYGYTSIGSERDLYEKVDMKERNLKRNETAALISNATMIPRMQWLENETKEQKSILESRDIIKYRGVVTSTYDAQVNGYFGKNGIEIANTMYSTTYEYAEDLLGTEVNYFVDSDSGEIVYIAKHKERDSITVSSENIEPETTISTFVYKDGSKKKTETIPATARIVYNGKVLTSGELTQDALIPHTGTVTLIDSNDDSVYDIAVVWEYQSVILSSYVNETIYGRYGEKIELPDGDTLTIKKDTKDITMSDVSVGDVMVIAASKDGEKVKIIVGSREETGTLKSINNKNGIYTFTSDGRELNLALSYEYRTALANNNSKAQRLTPGDTALLMLDVFGKIVAATIIGEESTDVKYGYLQSWILGDGDENAIFTILTYNNKFEKFVTAGDTVMFGRRNGASYTTSKTKVTEVISAITENQLVTYRVDEEGYLAEIKLADTSYNKDSISIDRSGSFVYTGDRVLLGQYIVDEKTKCFYIPSNGSYKELMEYGLYNQYLTVGEMSRGTFYDIEDNHVGAIVISPTTVYRYEAENNGYTVIIDKVNSPVLYINDATVMVDANGEEKTLVTGFQDGKKVEIFVPNELSAISEDVNALKSGAAIQYELNTIFKNRAETSDINLEMELYKTIFDFDANHSLNEQKYNYTTKELTRPEISTAYTTISSIDDGSVMFDTNRAALIHPQIMVLKYNRSTGEFEEARIEDLAVGQEVFVRQRYWNIREIVILYN